MNIRYPIYEGVYRILTFLVLSENRKTLFVSLFLSSVSDAKLSLT